MVRNNGKCLLIMVFIYTEKEIKMNYQAKVVSFKKIGDIREERPW